MGWWTPGDEVVDGGYRGRKSGNGREIEVALRVDGTGQVVGKEDKTTARYEREAVGLMRRYSAKHDRELSVAEAIHVFIARDGEYARGTIGVYRGGLRLMVERALLNGTMDAGEAEALDALAGTGPRPMLTGDPRTSGKKVTRLRKNELPKLMRFLIASPHELDKFLALYCYFGLRFFCRPIEWSTATMTEASLTLTNAKATNGRAHGETRMFLIDKMSDDQKRGLATFLADFARWAEYYGGYEQFQKVYARRLTRVSRLAGIRPLAPTTFRHAGMAIAKQMEGVAEVAYLAGHRSLATAGRHYAKRRSALPGLSLVVRAPAEAVSDIAFSGSATRRQKPGVSSPGLR